MTLWAKEQRSLEPRPILAALAVVVDEDHVLLVQRKNPPDQGLWGFPGGKVEYGEEVKNAAIRELREETAIEANQEAIITAVDAIEKDRAGDTRSHFLMIAVTCKWTSGNPKAGDDAKSAQWVLISDVIEGKLPLSDDVTNVLKLAIS